jgi:glycosyltransferase involved in cell wall biosynthesis
MLWPFVVRASRFADLIIANSWAGASYHIEAGYPAEKVVVIPNGVDTDVFHPDPDAGQRYRCLFHFATRLSSSHRCDLHPGQHRGRAVRGTQTNPQRLQVSFFSFSGFIVYPFMLLTIRNKTIINTIAPQSQ